MADRNTGKSEFSRRDTGTAEPPDLRHSGPYGDRHKEALSEHLSIGAINAVEPAAGLRGELDERSAPCEKNSGLPTGGTSDQSSDGKPNGFNPSSQVADPSESAKIPVGAPLSLGAPGVEPP